MATTPGTKVRNGKPKGSHRSMSEDPPYYGDPETLKSGAARADDIEKITPQMSVGGRAPALDMTKDFVAGHDGWPQKVEG